jgi:ribosomal protein S6
MTFWIRIFKGAKAIFAQINYKNSSKKIKSFETETGFDKYFIRNCMVMKKIALYEAVLMLHLNTIWQYSGA